jgi:tRNA (guanine26-N2/guanine27-N2)-dimethyltransferase
VLDGLAGCGIRSVRYALEVGVNELVANDADPDRLPLLRHNLAALEACAGLNYQASTQTIQKLLASFVLQDKYFDFVDLDAFGAATDLLPAAIGAVRPGGVIYLASSDGRSFTGHDRAAAVRRLGAAARAQPCSWELGLRPGRSPGRRASARARPSRWAGREPVRAAAVRAARPTQTGGWQTR